MPQVQVPAPQLEAHRAVQEDVSQVIAAVMPAVVSVSRPGQAQDAQPAGPVTYLTPGGNPAAPAGSGIVVDERGYVLTTFQSVGKASVVKVTVFSGSQKEYLADVVGIDSTCDLALLKVRANKMFAAVPLGNSDAVNVGDIVFAVGNPFGFTGTVTMGIVSSASRQVTIQGVRYPDLIQTDAAINDGNNGGPLINIRGEVVGVNMATLMPDHKYSGIGFAAPINNAANLLSGRTR
ncbi:Magetosome protein mamE-Nter [Fundidesulfovibrio magnetotacticus]|uniref:Magetosome protein mamE-Nter n=2 Tax=Fundidesulfovibrio magnetotacticus TaxID=2730080 RepID=A0A6V8LHV4_9BACT|nr:Magetosome protein mamE-Nter [Fundidesulfovibrio magnetotacticus]